MENVKNLVRMEGYKLLCIRKALFGYLALMVFSAFAIQSAGFFFFILLYLLTYTPKIGRASCRESVWLMV